MKKIVLKLLSIILLLVLSVNIISCDKGSKKDFEKAISLGNENNYTEIVYTSNINNGKENKTTISKYVTRDKIKVTNSSLEVYCFSYKDNYYMNNPILHTITEEEFTKTVNNGIFDLLDYSDFKYKKGEYVFNGDSTKEKELADYFFGSNLMNNYDSFSLKIKINNGEITKINVKSESKLTENNTIIMEYKYEYSNYGKTVVEIPDSLLSQID